MCVCLCVCVFLYLRDVCAWDFGRAVEVQVQGTEHKGKCCHLSAARDPPGRGKEDSSTQKVPKWSTPSAG